MAWEEEDERVKREVGEKEIEIFYVVSDMGPMNFKILTLIPLDIVRASVLDVLNVANAKYLAHQTPKSPFY